MESKVIGCCGRCMGLLVDGSLGEFNSSKHGCCRGCIVFHSELRYCRRMLLFKSDQAKLSSIWLTIWCSTLIGYAMWFYANCRYSLHYPDFKKTTFPLWTQNHFFSISKCISSFLITYWRNTLATDVTSLETCKNISKESISSNHQIGHVHIRYHHYKHYNTISLGNFSWFCHLCINPFIKVQLPSIRGVNNYLPNSDFRTLCSLFLPSSSQFFSPDSM